MIQKLMIFACILIILSTGCKVPAQIVDNDIPSPDVLRGSNGPQRSWWDVLHYSLDITPNIANKSLSGEVKIRFKALKEGSTFQIDLQSPLVLNSVSLNARKLEILKVNANTYFVKNLNSIKVGTTGELILTYSGTPIIAKLPPWDGGVQWTTDSLGRDWVGVACQGKGASVWWPCKDIQSDEPDEGADIYINARPDLTAVSNGKLISAVQRNGLKRWHWQVANPINNYCITMNLGYYTPSTIVYHGKNGILPITVYLLDYHKSHMEKVETEITSMLQCFEEKVYPYPFYEDGYKLTETAFLGMEHQSNIAYGNKFLPGYLGTDRSGTGVGLAWDFIIVHESGHEWFGNSITASDITENWIHEGFTTYLETIFTECQQGIAAGQEYVQGQRKIINNDAPLIGKYGINKESTSDIYDKGSSLIHTIRMIIADDENFYAMLHAMNQTFYHKIVTSLDIEHFISAYTGLDLSVIFDQYLRSPLIPRLVYSLTNETMQVHFENCNANFRMPVDYYNSEGKKIRVEISTSTQTIILKGSFDHWDPNFLLKLVKK